MRVSDDLGVVFVHVPKAAGSTIDSMFDREVPDARRIKGLRRHATLDAILRTEPQLAGHWKFGFVRNPWDRMVSWWSMYAGIFARQDTPKVQRKLERHPQIFLPMRDYVGTFDSFVLEGTEHLSRFRRQQSSLLHSAKHSVDFVGRVESMAADVAEVRKRLGLTQLEALPRRNVSKRTHYRDYYTPETRDRVADLFQDDIRRYGYDF